MTSYVISLSIALIAGLACQMTIGRELERETRIHDETTTIYSEYVEAEGKDEEKWLNENEEAYDTGDTQKNSKESNVELVSKHFDTSPLTLKKFMAKNSNPNEDGRHVIRVTDVTDSADSRRKIQETVEESRPHYYTKSTKNVNKDARGKESNEDNESGEKCDTHKRDRKYCENFCKMAARKNILTKKNISINSEDVAGSENSSTEINTVNGTEEFSKVHKESDTARIIATDYSTPSRREAPRLYQESTPSDTQDAKERVGVKYYEKSKESVPPIIVSLYKRLIPYMRQSPEVMESAEATTAVGSDLLHEAIESDTVTSNVEKPITSGKENKKDSSQRGESLESSATWKFADSERVNKTLTSSVDNAANSNDDESNFQDARASQAPQSRLYAYDPEGEKEDDDERVIQPYLKKANERWINIIINNYPPHACNNEKM
ncbi:uncharacterized protein LOC107273479 [Cephus cinctus]|uniref:Uncharacterized protein LOC107273479 n=1 Tax=Cephus cinctus TaxID=211228 RepID=A0AAJ7CDC8_CEPCN|nr:uncharacterized protein LOC107273479 [Cephus cinctus]